MVLLGSLNVSIRATGPALPSFYAFRACRLAALFTCGPASPLRSINEATAAIPCWDVYHDSRGTNATLDCGEKTALGEIKASDLLGDPV